MLRDCLQYLAGRGDLHVTALVHKRELCDYTGIDYIEIPWSVESWLKRLKCEYITMNRISKTLPKTDLWLSLHDTTPRVRAKRQAVYCHTSFPFMKPTVRDWKMDRKIVLFSLFTRYAYKWNVQRNRYLIVQQDWMRQALATMIGFPVGKIIVAPPAFNTDFSTPPSAPLEMTKRPPMFLYVGTPDCHKNFETLCEAARILEERIGKGAFRLLITVKGDENQYAEWLHRHWCHVDSIDFHGLLSREDLAKSYGEAACLVFPSRVESWGLPISEFLPTGKPMILADLPYAHSTSAGAKKVAFFKVTDAGELADRMNDLLEGKEDTFKPVDVSDIKAPYAANWDELFEMLLK